MFTKVRTRIAPSPTGMMHLGTARTAIYCWAVARHFGGEFLLRIEDTDRERSTPEATQVILDAMKWLNLDYDNKEVVYQMNRLPRYKEVVDQLLAKGLAYKCYATKEELDEMREAQKARGEKPRYDGLWRPENCVGKPIPEGVTPVIRFRNPDDGVVTWEDGVYGEITVANSELDDLVIMRGDGIPTYNFAVVVDDHMMRISHVLRAEEHLSNTPKQILMYEACGFEPPKFGHMPMILAPDRSKLSKRHGATSVEEFRSQGYLNKAIVNYLTLLGWGPGDEREIFSLEETVKLFELEQMSKKAAVYDVKKLTWMNGQYLSSLPLEEILPEAEPFFVKSGLVTQEWLDNNKEYFAKLVDVVRVRVKTLQEVVDAAEYFFKDVESYDEKGVAKHFKPEAAELLKACIEGIKALPEFNLETTEALYNKIAEEHGLSLGKAIHPTRLALTGRTVSPGLFDVMVLLGREKTLERMEKAVEFIKNM